MARKKVLKPSDLPKCRLVCYENVAAGESRKVAVVSMDPNDAWKSENAPEWVESIRSFIEGVQTAGKFGKRLNPERFSLVLYPEDYDASAARQSEIEY